MSSGHPAIAFLLNSLEFGGAQRVFVDDANDFVRAGFAVSFFVLYGKEGDYTLARELDVRVEKVFLDANGPADAAAIQKCLTVIDKKNIAVLLSTLNDGNSFARRVVRSAGARLRWIAREANALSSKTFLQKAADAVSFRIPYKIIALSSEIKSSLSTLLPFAREKIVLLPNAIQLPTFVRTQSKNTVPLILSVGRLDRQKNPELLIVALGELARSGQVFTAILVGDGPLREVLAHQIRQEKLEGIVTLARHLPHGQVLELYKKADIFVSTSRWEGSPNVILEALSYGLPVVATSVGGTPDVITNEKQGLLIPSQSKAALVRTLAQVIGDATLREAFGQAGRERVKADFSREARFQRLRAIVDPT